MSAPLLYPNNFITSIISQLRTIDFPLGAGLSSLARRDFETVKCALTALHFLFPHEVLPALDLLDRKLVTQLVVIPTPDSARSTPQSNRLFSQLSQGSSGAPCQTPWEIFFVQSASATASTSKSNSRYRKVYHPTSTYYEVRLDAWNCTCPAFAFSAFSGVAEAGHGQGSPDDDNDQTLTGIDGGGKGLRFGGMLTRDGAEAPICKHILAAMVGKALPRLFGHGVERKEVMATEVAGWSAGWGD